MKSLLAPAVLASMLLAGCAMQRPDAVAYAPIAAPEQAEVAEKTKREQLVQQLEENFKDERFADATWGLLVMSAETGEVWYESNADEKLIPASNEKAPTSMAALTYLGPDFRYETIVGHTGEIDEGVLYGDLVVFGQGDPTFYDKWHDDSRTLFYEWADKLKEKGITKIAGNIIGDDNAWDNTHTGSGWPEQALTPWYYAEYGALNFNENYVDIMIHPPESPGGEVRLEPNVPSSYYELVNNIEVVEEGSNRVSMNRESGTNTITLSGTVKAGTSAFEETPTITNPTLFFTTVLKESLEEKGIEVTGAAIDVDDLEEWDRTPDTTRGLITEKSPPLHEILAMLYKRSQNMYAETMVYTMGWKSEGVGTFENGKKIVQEQMRKLGIPPTEYEFMDGSGLSRQNLLTPRVVSWLYYAMQEHEHFDHWWNMQSIAGEDGTLRSRMKGTAAQGNARGKTGTLSGVRALSGYVTSAAGERLIFSFMVNNHTTSSAAVNEVTDPAVIMLAEYDGN